MLPLPPSDLPHGVDFDDTLGALFIAETVSAILFGVTSVQTYMYIYRAPRDGVFMRRTICFLWVIDALHLVLASHGIYRYTISNFMNPLAMLYCPWSFALDVPTGYLLEAPFYSFSLRLLSASLSGGSIAICILAFRFSQYSEFRARYAWIWHMTFAVQAFADCAIAVSLCTLLVRRRTGFKRTGRPIHDLVLYSVSTCMLTSSVGIACVITYAVMPHNFVFIGIAFTLPKLMLNALLALLNSRDALRDRHVAKGSMSIHLSRLAQPERSTLDGAHASPPLGQADKHQELGIAVRAPEASFDRDCESQASRAFDV